MIDFLRISDRVHALRKFNIFWEANVRNPSLEFAHHTILTFNFRSIELPSIGKIDFTKLILSSIIITI